MNDQVRPLVVPELARRAGPVAAMRDDATRVLPRITPILLLPIGVGTVAAAHGAVLVGVGTVGAAHGAILVADLAIGLCALLAALAVSHAGLARSGVALSLGLATLPFISALASHAQAVEGLFERSVPIHVQWFFDFGSWSSDWLPGCVVTPLALLALGRSRLRQDRATRLALAALGGAVLGLALAPAAFAWVAPVLIVGCAFALSRG